jgi:hypothetical protein
MPKQLNDNFFCYQQIGVVITVTCEDAKRRRYKLHTLPGHEVRYLVTIETYVFRYWISVASQNFIMYRKTTHLKEAITTDYTTSMDLSFR